MGPRHHHRHAAVAWAGACLAAELDYLRLFPVQLWRKPGWREAFIYVSETAGRARVVGAGACRLPNYPNLPGLRELVFVYFDPQFRGRGLLNTLWPQLTGRWGPFVVQAPLSDAMSRFLARQPQTLVTQTPGEPPVMVFGAAAGVGFPGRQPDIRVPGQ